MTDGELTDFHIAFTIFIVPLTQSKMFEQDSITQHNYY